MDFSRMGVITLIYVFGDLHENPKTFAAMGLANRLQYL
jgi:hypothetical protein